MIRARRAVVLAGGVFGTPQLLMLSGIGPGAHLREHGVTVRVDRPAVGANLQDHVDYVAGFETAGHLFHRPVAEGHAQIGGRGDPVAAASPRAR